MISFLSSVQLELLLYDLHLIFLLFICICIEYDFSDNGDDEKEVDYVKDSQDAVLRFEDDLKRGAISHSYSFPLPLLSPCIPTFLV